MLVTFTRRAAREMVDRAARLTGADLSGVTAGTFHSICRRLLHRYGPLVGVPAAFTILDGEDQAEVVAIARDAVLAEPRDPARAAEAVGDRGLRLARGRVGANARGRRAGAQPPPGRPPGGPDRHRRGVRRAQAGDGGARLRRPARPGRAPGGGAPARPAAPGRGAPLGAGRRAARREPGPGPARRGPGRRGLAPGRRGRPRPVDLRLARRRPRGRRPVRRRRGHAGVPAADELPLDPRGRRARPGDAPGGQPLRQAAGGPPARVGRAAGRGPPRLGAGRGRLRHPAHRRPHHRGALPGGGRRALPRAPPLGGAPARPGGGRRRVRAVLGRQVRRERPREGRPGVLPPAPQPARRARLAPGAAAVRARRPGRRGAGLGADRRPARPPGRRRRAAAVGLRRRRPGGASPRPSPTWPASQRPEQIVLRVARADWYRDHLQRTYPNWRDREGDLARLAEIAARSPGLDRFLGDLQLAERLEADEDVSGPGAEGRAVQRPPGQGPRVAGRLRPPGRGGIVPVRLGGERGQPRRGGAALLRRRHPRRRRAVPLPARSPRAARGTPAPTRWC